MRTGRPCHRQRPDAAAKRPRAHAREVGADLWLAGRDFNHSGDRQQWAWAGRGKRLHGLAYPALRGANQIVNAAGVLAALQAMHQRLPVPAQAVRQGLASVELPGRFQIVPGQPTLVLDVAHNPHSVAALAAQSRRHGVLPPYACRVRRHARQGPAALISRVAPIVDAWYCTDLPLPGRERAGSGGCGAQRGGGGPDRVDAREPVCGTRAAMAAADPADRILVFGSFLTVGGVLKEGLPRLGALHST
jgi:dihydrofolate synthase/folylpolyglutamate synthase